VSSGLRRGFKPAFRIGLISRLKCGFRTKVNSVLSRSLKPSLISGFSSQLTTALSPNLKAGLKSRLKSQFRPRFRTRVRRGFTPRLNSVLASGVLT
jgi:hypothetical protein